MSIGNRLKQLRKELGLTQEAFASRIGSVQNTITGYENDRRNPSAPVISLICREFNVNEEWLREGKGEMFVETSEDEQIAEFVGRTLSGQSETFRRRLILALSALNDDEWDLLEQILDKMTKKKE